MSPKLQQMKRSEQLRTLLDNTRVEREVHRFLEENPDLLGGIFNRTGNMEYVVSKPDLGNEFQADFVTLQPFSGGWDIDLVELEPPDEPMFNADGTFAKRLNQAMRQIDDWRSFLKDSAKEAYFRQQLFNAAKFKNLLYPERNGTDPTCTVGWLLTDARSSVTYWWHIVIGRRGKLSEKDIKRKATFANNHDIDLLTYDRFIDAAEEIETHPV